MKFKKSAVRKFAFASCKKKVKLNERKAERNKNFKFAWRKIYIFKCYEIVFLLFLTFESRENETSVERIFISANGVDEIGRGEKKIMINLWQQPTKKKSKR